MAGWVDGLEGPLCCFAARGWVLLYVNPGSDSTPGLRPRERERERENTRRQAPTVNSAEAYARVDSNLEERAVVVDESVNVGIENESVHT